MDAMVYASFSLVSNLDVLLRPYRFVEAFSFCLVQENNLVYLCRKLICRVISFLKGKPGGIPTRVARPASAGFAYFSKVGGRPFLQRKLT